MKPQRRRIAAGMTAGLLGSGVAGLLLLAPSPAGAADPAAAVAAQAPPTTEPTSDDTATDDDEDDVDDVDDEGVDDGDDSGVDSGRGDRIAELLQPLVDDGTLTAEQVEAVIAELQSGALPEIWVHGPDIVGRPGMPGLPGRPDRPDDRPGGPAGPMSLDVLVDVIGIDPAELREQLRDGATLAEIATANGVEPQAVIDAIVAEVGERVATAVENGRISQDEADEHLAEITEDVTEWVNGDPDDADDADDDSVDDSVDDNTADADTTVAPSTSEA